MRWLIVVLASCGFSPTLASHVDPSGDGGVSDAAIDAPVLPPACLGNPNYVMRSGSAHLYKITNDSPQFDDAIEECQQDGAYLTRVDDSIENVYIVTTFGSVWVGASDQETEATFRSVSYDNQPVPFKNFISPEPNDNGNNEDCVYVKGDGSWNDTPCDDNNHKALCECDPNYQAPPVPACRFLPNAKTVESRKYFVHSTPASWSDAEADCASSGAYLVVPSDDKENSWIQGGQINVNAPAWIGGKETDITWAWADHSPFGYMNFSDPSAPDQCALIQTNGKWTPTDCTEPHAYVCECPP